MQHRGRVLAFLLLAAGIVGLVFWPHDRGGDSLPEVTDDVRACVERLRSIHEALVAYQDLHGALPSGTGSAFLAALVAPGIWDGAPEELACPAGGSYAVRDFAAHPLPSFPAGGDEALLACDSTTGMSHDGAMNVLFADKSVRTILLTQEIEAGRLAPGTTVLRAGPDSPLPVLRVLRVD